MSNVEPPALSKRRPFPWGDSIENGLVIYFISSLIVFLGIFLGTDLLSSARRGGSPRSVPLCNDSVLDSMDQWDGQYYLKIAQRGYDYDPTHGSTVAFFPGYPALVAAVYRTGIPIELAGLLVAHLFLALAFVLFWAYCKPRSADGPPQWQTWAMVSLALFPTTCFMRMTYSESLFLFLAILAMLGMQRNWHPIWIAVLVGCATGTRPVGVALLLPFGLSIWRRATSWRQALLAGQPLLPGMEYLQSNPKRKRGFPRLRFGLLLICFRAGVICLLAMWGLIAFLLLQYVQFGAPLAFIQTQSNWQMYPKAACAGKTLSLLTFEPIWSAYLPSWPGYCGRFGTEMPSWCNLSLANPVFFVLAVALIVWGSFKRWLSQGEILLSGGLLLIPYVTRSFEMCMQSQGRFVGVVFPIYLVLGRLLSQLPLMVSIGIVTLAGLLLAAYSALFCAGFMTI